VQVKRENPDNLGEQAVRDLHELRDRIFKDPTLELDVPTKRLRQANFKQQYKLRQERNCQEDLSAAEHQALLACSGHAGAGAVASNGMAMHAVDGDLLASSQMYHMGGAPNTLDGIYLADALTFEGPSNSVPPKVRMLSALHCM
jgi:hypothetical protein